MGVRKTTIELRIEKGPRSRCQRKEDGVAAGHRKNPKQSGGGTYFVKQRNGREIATERGEDAKRPGKKGGKSNIETKS